VRLSMRLPQVVANEYAALPDVCPNPKQQCRGRTFHSHGFADKPVRDVFLHQVRAKRWQCDTCGYTFRIYPLGVTKRQQSDRLRALSVLMWLIGGSLGGVVDLLTCLGCPIARSTVYNNLQGTGQRARERQRARLRGKIQAKVIGIDCTHVRVKGRDKIAVETVDAATGASIEIDILPGEDARRITRYLKRIAKLTGAEVVVTDDADAFKTAADEAGIDHQLCQKHVVPNVLTILSSLAAEAAVAVQGAVGPGGLTIDNLLSDLAALEEIILARAAGSLKILAGLLTSYQGAPGPKKGRKASLWYRMRLLLLDLVEDWPRLTLTDRRRDKDGRRLVPPTNNVTEQAIGSNLKERYRSMRGFKSVWSVKRIGTLMASLRDAHDEGALTALLSA
jgi:transposase-like protein